jgi:hypothetical protein
LFIAGVIVIFSGAVVIASDKRTILAMPACGWCLTAQIHNVTLCCRKLTIVPRFWL